MSLVLVDYKSRHLPVCQRYNNTCLGSYKLNFLLSKELQEIANNADNGLILFSLGTNFHSQDLGESVITSILECFENFPEYTFLWKIDLENDAIRTSSNVIVRKWIPQNDILGNFDQESKTIP